MATSPSNPIAVTERTGSTPPRSPLTPLPLVNVANVAQSTTRHGVHRSALLHSTAASAAFPNSGGIAIGGGEESSSSCRRALFPSSINEGIEDSSSSLSNGDRTSLKRNYGAVSGVCEENEEEGVVLSSDSNKSHQVDAASSTDDVNHYATNEVSEELFIPWEPNDDSVKQSVSHLPAKDLRDADKVIVEGVLTFKSNFRTKEADSDASNFQPTAYSAEEENFFDNIAGHVKKRWEQLPHDVRKKLKGIINPNPPHCYIGSAFVKEGDELVEKIVAAMTSLGGGGEWVPGKNGEKKWLNHTRSNGKIDRESLAGKLGGRYDNLYGLKVNETAENYRNRFNITRVSNDSCPEFIAAMEEAKENESLLESLMKEVEADREKTNGMKPGETITYYLMEPAEDCTNENDDLPDQSAKSKGFHGIQKLIGNTTCRGEISDEIPRFKGKKKRDHKLIQNDLLSYLESADTFKLNGYNISKILSDEEFDATIVTKTYDSKANGYGVNVPSPLPKRMKIGGSKKKAQDFYLIEPAEDCTNKDEQFDNETAKAKNINGLQRAIGGLWYEETSDRIPRLKESKKGQKYWNKSDIAAHLGSGNTCCKLNGYNISKIESDEEYDAAQVTKNYDDKAVGDYKSLPSPLPKRKKAC